MAAVVFCLEVVGFWFTWREGTTWGGGNIVMGLLGGVERLEAWITIMAMWRGESWDVPAELVLQV